MDIIIKFLLLMDIYKISITESDELNEFISLIGTKIFKN